jgi:hypothetical protein
MQAVQTTIHKEYTDANTTTYWHHCVGIRIMLEKNANDVRIAVVTRDCQRRVVILTRDVRPQM